MDSKNFPRNISPVLSTNAGYYSPNRIQAILRFGKQHLDFTEDDPDFKNLPALLRKVPEHELMRIAVIGKNLHRHLIAGNKAGFDRWLWDLRSALLTMYNPDCDLEEESDEDYEGRKPMKKALKTAPKPSHAYDIEEEGRKPSDEEISKALDTLHQCGDSVTAVLMDFAARQVKLQEEKKPKMTKEETTRRLDLLLDHMHEVTENVNRMFKMAEDLLQDLKAGK